MKKTLLAILLGLCGAIPLCAQSTTVSVTVVDQTAQAWANGTISYTFSPTPGIPGPFYWGGAIVPVQYMTPITVALDGSGSASFSVPTNTAITPSGSGWLYNVCPNASAKCVQLIIPAAGSTQNISAAVTAVLKALQVNAANLPKAYSDSEVVTVPAQGGTYYNVLGQAIRYFNGSVWANLAGSGVITAVTATAPVDCTTSGSSVNCGMAPAGTTVGTYSAGVNLYLLAVDSVGNVWVTNRSVNTVTELSPSGSILGTYAVGTNPEWVAIDAQGNVWVGNNQSGLPGTVTKLSAAGVLLGTFTLGGAGPYGIAVDASGNVWVADNESNNVTKLSSAGSILGTYTVSTGAISPTGIAVDAAGNVWVAVTDGGSNNNVVKLSSTGTILGTFAVGNTPLNVSVDAMGSVWVTNFGTNTITKLSSSGSVLGTFAVGNSPYVIAFDSVGNAWVGNHGDSTVSELSSSGVVLGTFTIGAPGNPAGLAIDTSGNVWVANHGGTDPIFPLGSVSKLISGSGGVQVPLINPIASLGQWADSSVFNGVTYPSSYSQYALLTAPTATSVGSLLPSSWTTGHTFVPVYQPSGSAIAPTIVDANTLNVATAVSAVSVECAGYACPNHNQYAAPFTPYVEWQLASNISATQTTIPTIATIGGAAVPGCATLEQSEIFCYTSLSTTTFPNDTFAGVVRGVNSTAGSETVGNGIIQGIVTDYSSCATCSINWAVTNINGSTYYGATDIGHGATPLNVQGNIYLSGSLYGIGNINYLTGGINATPIGNVTPAAGAFTSVTIPSCASGTYAKADGSGCGTPSGSYTLPTATSSVLGGVKPDGTSILNTAGAISATAASVGADAAGAAATAQSNAETYASNASNLSSGTVALARMAQSSTSTSGYLSSTDWNTFNNKQAALTNPVTGPGSPTANDAATFTGTGDAVQDSGAPISWFGTGNANIGGSLPTASTGGDDTSVGYGALGGTTSGSYSTALGHYALHVNTIGNGNTAIGESSQAFSTTASYNTSVGDDSLGAATYGGTNSALGYQSLEFLTIGTNNTAIGAMALKNITTGSTNVAIGSQAGQYKSGGSVANTTSSSSTYIGASTYAFADGDTNENVIGNAATGNGSNTTTLGNSSITDTYLQGIVHGTSFTGTAANITATSNSTLTTLPSLSLPYSQVSGTPTLGNWAALNYPTYVSPSFVKMTAAGTFALDTNTYGTFTLPSLTSGSVLFSNGSTIAQDNSNFFWDATNHRLGIGTTSPAAALDVLTTNPLALNLTSSAYATTFYLNNTSAAGHNWALESTGTGSGFGTGLLALWDATASIEPISFSSTAVTTYVPLTVTATGNSSFAGNVSIGDTTATSMFNVGTANQFRVSSIGVSSAGAGSTDLNGSGVPEAHCLADGTGGGVCGTSTPAFSAITSATNTTAAMVVGSGASLGASGTGTINATALNGATFASPGPIGFTTPNTSLFTSVTSGTLNMSSQCVSIASPAACASASQGFFIIAAGSTSVTVNTTHTTGVGTIAVYPDTSIGSALGVTCNTTLASIVNPVITARTAGTSFTVSIPGTLAVNPGCYSYTLIN
jgi:streptogramin lyase